MRLRYNRPYVLKLKNEFSSDILFVMVIKEASNESNEGFSKGQKERVYVAAFN